MAAAADDLDRMCREFFQMNVEKEQAKKLSPEEKKYGKGTTVRKILKDGLGETSGTISACEASIYPKYQDKKTKKITDDIFVKQILPEVAAMKAKGKVGDVKSEAELAKMKKKLCDQLDKSKKAPAAKNAAVVDRLTDTSKYTGAHKERFDESGKGKGKDGREDQVDDSGYVGNYKGAGTFDKK